MQTHLPQVNSSNQDVLSTKLQVQVRWPQFAISSRELTPVNISSTCKHAVAKCHTDTLPLRAATSQKMLTCKLYYRFVNTPTERVPSIACPLQRPKSQPITTTYSHSLNRDPNTLYTLTPTVQHRPRNPASPTSPPHEGLDSSINPQSGVHPTSHCP